MALLTGMNIANIERVKVVTKETTPKTYQWDTATSATVTPKISEGQEVTQRVKNSILGRIKTEDLVEGYDIELEDERIIIELYQLMDGGTLTMDTQTPTDWASYAAPVAGSSVTKTKFDVYLYTSDRDSDGDAKEYLEWKLADCKGAVNALTMADGSFAKPKYTIASRPANGTSPLTITRADSLPAAT